MESPEIKTPLLIPEKLGHRYFYGTTLDEVLNSLDIDTGIIDSRKISPSAKRFNYFRRFPGFIEFFGPFFTGLQAAAHYAFIKQEEKLRRRTDLKSDECLPLVVSGNIPRRIKTRGGVIGSIAETTQLPVNKIYLLNPKGISSKLKARLVPPSYEKLTLDQFKTRFKVTEK